MNASKEQPIGGSNLVVGISFAGAPIVIGRMCRLSSDSVEVFQNKLPLTVGSTLELELFDGVDRFRVPGTVITENGDTWQIQLGKTGKAFRLWISRKHNIPL